MFNRYILKLTDTKQYLNDTEKSVYKILVILIKYWFTEFSILVRFNKCFRYTLKTKLLVRLDKYWLNIGLLNFLSY